MNSLQAGILLGGAALTGGVLAGVIALRASRFARAIEDTTVLNPHVRLRCVRGVVPPVGIWEAAEAIDRVLTSRYGRWWDRIELVVEWYPYDAVITGPFMSTGYYARGTNRAVVAPPQPPPIDVEKFIARGNGTVRKEMEWPWSKRARFVAMIVDRRIGETKREFLLREDVGRPRAPVMHTSLFYEIAFRVAPLGLDGLEPEQIGEHLPAYGILEVEMKRQYAALMPKADA